MENRTQKGPETLGQAARRLLDRIDARKKKASGGLQRPDKIEPAAKGQGGPASQATGIRAQGGRGLEMNAGELSGLPGCNDALARYQRGNTYRYDFTNAGRADHASGDARWIEFRCRCGRPEDVEICPRLSMLPANRSADNDNGIGHAATAISGQQNRGPE
jgi:hypothetical protein